MLVTCHLCGATVDTAQAKRVRGLPGHGDALFLAHDRPDGKGKCRLWTGPPLPARATLPATATTLSAAREAPESA